VYTAAYADDAMVAVNFRHPIVPATNRFCNSFSCKTHNQPTRDAHYCFWNVGLGLWLANPLNPSPIRLGDTRSVTRLFAMDVHGA
jgi:hypothetical protein